MDWSALVGGKAVGLSRLIGAGERVPAGFCVTTSAYAAARASSKDSRTRIPPELREQIVAACEQLGAGRVAVRSSATAEDLPLASFAGQYETVLDVQGTEAVFEAVTRCWASLSNPRAVAYLEAAGLSDESVRMAVVVQHMVDAAAAGVLFTANPMTGTRSEMVVDAVAGRGDAVVDGSVVADHYVLGPATVGESGAGEAEPHGCLNREQLAQLRAAGERVARHAGSPQDIEWAFDSEGVLWLLQSRAITTLFPLPEPAPEELHVYLEAGHLQGMLRPFTPMGMSAMQGSMKQWAAAFGAPRDPAGEGKGSNDGGIVDVAGRMYLDLTAAVRSRAYRAKLPAAMEVYGPRVTSALELVLQDPRLAPDRLLPFRLRPAAARRLAGLGCRMAGGLVRALASPGGSRRVALQAAVDVRRESRGPVPAAGASELLARASRAQVPLILHSMMEMLPPLYGYLMAKGVATSLLAGVASESEIDETLRGMPNNVTTQMDLRLWRIAAENGAHRALLVDTPPGELAARYLAGDLPDIGLGAFLRRYGHRGAAEIDVGVARWGEDPTPVFAALAGYLRVTDPEQAPDRRFALAAQEATAKIDELVARARATRPVRAYVAGVLLRRARALAGMRELPKFAWLFALARMRSELLAAGADLQSRGLLERAGDIMFLDLGEAGRAAAGADLRDLVAVRRAEYERERRRRSIPGLLLSDGTIPEALAPRAPAADGALTGLAAAPGHATGRARVVLDPAGARVEPGEILVAPTTDPGWTPLFLTAGGLVTETGAAIAHGPTVAREYGIPAVICVRDATQLISTGQLITVDGAAGTVRIEDDLGAPSSGEAAPGRMGP